MTSDQGLPTEAASDDRGDDVIGDDGRRHTLRQWCFHSPRRLGAIALAVLIVVAAVLAAWLYLFEYKPGVQTDAHVADTVTSAARDGTVALLSYSPDSLQGDFERARSHLTGGFLDYYNKFTTEVVTPAATEKKVKTEANVVRAAVTELQVNSAKVLVFISQNTTSSDKPDPSLTSSSVVVALQKHGDNWLISAFDPV